MHTDYTSMHTVCELQVAGNPFLFRWNNHCQIRIYRMHYNSLEMRMVTVWTLMEPFKSESEFRDYCAERIQDEPENFLF